MKKWIMRTGVVLLVLSLAGMLCAQSGGRRGWGMPGRSRHMRRMPFGPIRPAPAPETRPEEEQPPAGQPARQPAITPCPVMTGHPYACCPMHGGRRPFMTAGYGRCREQCPFVSAGYDRYREHCPFGGYGRFGAHHCRPVRAFVFLLVVVPVLVTLFWILPITIGVRIARCKNLSPLWMLFGICPLGGWLACLVLALAKGKVACANCGGYVKPNFRQCPYCSSPIESTKSSKSDK
jgi:hypothetical protein